MMVKSTLGLTLSSRVCLSLYVPVVLAGSQVSMEEKSMLRSTSLSNMGPAEWLPERRVERRRVILPSGSSEPESILSTSIHRCVKGMGFRKQAPQAFKEIWKFALKGVRRPGVHTNTRLSKAVWAKGMRNVSQCLCVVVWKI